jgi:hypothetical protein
VSRSRSAWKVVDLLLAAALAAILVSTLSSLGRYTSAAHAQWLIIAPPALAVMIASAVQVSFGRTDSLRSHRLLSLVLWPPLALWAYVLHHERPSLRFAPPTKAIAVDWAVPAAQGSWVIVGDQWGKGADWFLVNALTGRVAFFLDAGWWVHGGFSRDGSRAAWLTEGRDADLVTIDTDDARQPTVRFTVPGDASLLLSPHGRELLVLGPADLAVYDLESERRLFQWPTSPCVPGQAAFVTPHRARVFCADAGGFEIVEIDTSKGSQERTGRVEAPGNKWPNWRHVHWGRDFGGFILDPGGRRAVFVDRMSAAGRQGQCPITLRDGRSGALISTLVAGGPRTFATRKDASEVISAAFLADGRVVVLVEPRLLIFSAGGVLERELDAIDCIGGEPEAGRLYLCRGNDVILLDTSDGRVLREEKALRPAATASRFSTLDRDPMPSVPAGAEASRLFIDTARRRLVRLGPAGERVVVLPREGT